MNLIALDTGSLRENVTLVFGIRNVKKDGVRCLRFKMMQRYLMGKSLFKGDDEPYFYIQWESVNVIAGRTKSGKSVLLNHLAIAESKVKKFVLIFDYQGEHKGLNFPNFQAEKPDCILNLKYIENFGFMISDFDRQFYWETLGFPQGASRILAKYAPMIEKHNNDPAKFREMIEQLPTAYGNDSINVHSKQSILNRINERIFLNPNDPNEEKIHIPDWGQYLLMTPKLLINLNLGFTDISLARFYVGVILYQIKPYVIRRQISPISIFLEEADIICPNDVMDIPLSLTLVSDYSLKLQKYGVTLFLITQVIDRLSPSVRNNVYCWFLGKLFEGDILHDKTEKLQLDVMKGIRQFAMFYDGTNRLLRFVPFDAPNIYTKRR